jgi:hypothetical protein
MPTEVKMTTAQKFAIGATVLDKGKPTPKPFKSLPSGATLEFASSDPATARVEVRPDGLNADVFSDDVGTATVTVTPGGSWSNLPADTVTVVIENAEPDSLNLTVGAPEEE